MTDNSGFQSPKQQLTFHWVPITCGFFFTYSPGSYKECTGYSHQEVLGKDSLKLGLWKRFLFPLTSCRSPVSPSCGSSPWYATVIGRDEWFLLIFPLWVLLIGVYILIDNFQGGSAPAA
jgi:hypothetical protein